MKKQIISAALAAVISAGVFVSPVQRYVGTSTVAFAAETVSAPKASRKSGTYSSSGTLTVRLTADSGSQIYYSTGGSYKLYTKTLKITKNTTLKFYAQKNGAKSKTVTVKYKLTPKVKVTNAGGNYDSAVTVKLSSTASGVKFYYTLDGSKPTKSSALYTTKGITVSKSAKLRVLAAKTGWSGKYLAEEYTISGSEETSTLSGESILEDYKSKYAYNTLTAKQKKAYEKIFNTVSEYKQTIYFQDMGLTDKDILYTYWAFDYDNPQFFWLGNGYRYMTMANEVYSLTVDYSRTKSQAEKIQPLFDTAAQKVIDKALAQDNLFDRVLVIHDAITEMTTYNAKAPSYKSARVTRKRSCTSVSRSGYSASALRATPVRITCGTCSSLTGNGITWTPPGTTPAHTSISAFRIHRCSPTTHCAIHSQYPRLQPPSIPTAK